MRATMIFAAGLVAAGAYTASMHAAQEPPPRAEASPAPPPPRPKTLRERYDEIEKEQGERDQAYFKAYREAEPRAKKAATEEERRAIWAELWTKTPYVRHSREYMKRFEDLVDEAPDDPVAADALYAAFQSIGHGGYLVKGNDEAFRRKREDIAMSYAILDRMVRYAGDPRMKYYLQQIGLSPSTHTEHLCREVLARNGDHQALGHATQALANCMDYLAGASKVTAAQPESNAYIQKTEPAEELERRKGRDAAPMAAEAEALHEKVVAQFAGVQIFPINSLKDDPRTIAKQSIDWLAARRELAVGRPAPAIVGRDLDGKTFSLADYRGKVVALVFWASWCGPCMDEVPHERELAERMTGRPFALLGVNPDYTPGKARQTIAEERITWPNWYDGDPRKERPIGDAYHVIGIPSIFVLDRDGIIRFKDVRDKKLAEAVESLLKEAEAKGPQP